MINVNSYQYTRNNTNMNTVSRVVEDYYNMRIITYAEYNNLSYEEILSMLINKRFGRVIYRGLIISCLYYIRNIHDSVDIDKLYERYSVLYNRYQRRARRLGITPIKKHMGLNHGYGCISADIQKICKVQIHKPHLGAKQLGAVYLNYLYNERRVLPGTCMRILRRINNIKYSTEYINSLSLAIEDIEHRIKYMNLFN